MKPKLLVVDASLYLARTMAASLQLQGYATQVADNAVQALKLMDAGGLDAAVLDLDLQGRLDGPDLVEVAQVRRPGLPLVLTTHGWVVPGETASAALPLLRKPYLASDVVTALPAGLRRDGARPSQANEVTDPDAASPGFLEQQLALDNVRLFAQSGGGPGFLDLLRERLLLLSEGWSRLHLHEQEVRRLLAAKERLLRDLEQRRTRTTDPGRTGVQ
ncbi:response regulator [Lysobacter soli]|uniref:response regulator n=1 Tax=Lysobacter soli TaxID=453783 RepID=UPI0037C8AC8D